MNWLVKRVQLIIIPQFFFIIGHCFHDLPHMLIMGIAKQILNETDPEIYLIADKYLRQFEEEHLKGKVSFEENSLWSDDIKDHYKKSVDYWGHWHYIDNVFNPFNINAEEYAMDKEMNALKAFHQIKDVFYDKRNHGKISIIKHIYFKHLVHIVGDIHQPLHTMSLFNQKYLKGDAGGTKQFIQLEQRKTNLHFYFDSAAFFYNFKQRIQRPLNDTFKLYFQREVSTLILQYPFNSLNILQSEVNMEKWIEESFEISKSQIYSQIDLTNSVKVNKITPENHLKNTELSRRQIVKAGYRLAYVLIDFLTKEKNIYTFDTSTSSNSSESNNSENDCFLSTKKMIGFMFLQGVIFLGVIVAIYMRYSKVKQQQ